MYPKSKKQFVGSTDRVEENAATPQDGVVTATRSREGYPPGTHHSQSTSLDISAEPPGWPAMEMSGPNAQTLFGAGGVHYRTPSQFSSGGGGGGRPMGESPLPLYAGNNNNNNSSTAPQLSPHSSGTSPLVAPHGNGSALTSPRVASGSTAPLNDTALQEKRYAHLFEEHRKQHLVVREKAAEIDRLTGEQRRLQKELDLCRMELAAQRRHRSRDAAVVRAELMRLVTLIDVLLPPADSSRKTDGKTTSKANGAAGPTSPPPARVKRLQEAYAEVEKRMSSLADEAGVVPAPERWLFDTLNLTTLDIFAEPGVSSSQPAGSTPEDTQMLSTMSSEATGDPDKRLDIILEAREGALRAMEGLTHYLTVLDFGFPTTQLLSSAAVQPLSIDVLLSTGREGCHSAAGRPVVPIIPEPASA